MRSKLLVFWMMIVTICLYGVVAHKFEDFLKSVNKQRKHYMEQNFEYHVEDLKYDETLAKKVEGLPCTIHPPKGTRMFWIPKRGIGVDFYNEQVDAFMKNAKMDVNLGLHHVSEFPGPIETLSTAQKRIGCVWKQCTHGIEYDGMCLLGPKGTLTAEDLPYGRRTAYNGKKNELHLNYYFIDYLSKLRAKILNRFIVPGVRELGYDGTLIKNPRELSCSLNQPDGYRMFWLPKDETAFKYWEGFVDKFLDIAIVNIDQAIRHIEKFPGFVEAFSIKQTHVGCHWKECVLTVGGVDYKHSAICFLGPENKLTAEELPFERNFHTGLSVVHDFDRYTEEINKYRMKILKDNNLYVNTLSYNHGYAKSPAEHGCSPDQPKHHRQFWVPEDYAAFKYLNDTVYEFLEIARGDVDVAIHHIAHFTGYVELLSHRQSTIGCAWKKCSFRLNGIVYNFSALCFISTIRKLNPYELPYRRGEDLPEEETYWESVGGRPTPRS